MIFGKQLREIKAAFLMEKKQEVNMSKAKVQRELIKVREQLANLQKKEAHLVQELKMAEDAEKQSILDKHHISVEELTEMINAKKAEEKKLLAMAKVNESASITERSESKNE